MKRLSGKLTYANVVSTLCLILLVGGGSALAAGQLGRESVGTKQLKEEAVTRSKLSDAAKSALTGPQGKEGPRGQQGAKGDRGGVGAKGDKGEPGTPATVLWAVVNEDGTLARGKGISTTVRYIDGDYNVEFLRDLSQCNWEATLGSATDTGAPIGDIGTTLNSQDHESIGVQTTLPNGNRIDRPFHLVVFC